jgi:hypothetical protein
MHRRGQGTCLDLQTGIGHSARPERGACGWLHLLREDGEVTSACCEVAVGGWVVGCADECGVEVFVKGKGGVVVVGLEVGLEICEGREVGLERLS